MTETIDVDVSGIRSALLEVIGDLSSQYDNLQSSSVIQHAARKVLNRQPDRQVERALLASFYDLFRTGYLSWGHDLANPAPPFCHVTELGRRALAQRSRDPANPEGYLSHLRSRAGISSLTHSYVVEALNTFNAACFKATAVMVGAAAESLVLQVRDRLVERLQAIGRPIPSGLTDWRLKRILVAIEATTVARKASMPSALFERFEANWPAFTHQIRTARNEAGHPASVEPVTAEEVHASLLIFPELAALSAQLEAWIAEAAG
jgi:hypothetical protein